MKSRLRPPSVSTGGRSQGRRDGPTLRPAVLALQGSVEPHRKSVERLGHSALQIRQPHELEGVTHLILPGGESTTLAKLLDQFGLWSLIRERGADGSLALFGTCAGAILLGRPAEERPPRLGLIDVAMDRNAYGRQIDSFVGSITARPPLRFDSGVFIRAPRIRDIGTGVEELAHWNGEPVVVRQGRILAATFHPELSENSSLHAFFLSL